MDPYLNALGEAPEAGAVLDLPAVFVCVNNQWGMGTRIDQATKATALHERCEVRPHACLKCFMACGRLSTVKAGRFAGLKIEGPEYETIFALGSNCGIGDTNVILSADRLCDDYGLDTISCGGVIGFAMECFEMGLIDKSHTDGLDLSFGNRNGIALVAHRRDAPEHDPGCRKRRQQVAALAQAQKTGQLSLSLMSVSETRADRLILPSEETDAIR